METLEQLFLRRNSIKPGLDRMRVAYAELGRPSLKTRNILVGGTNGKGTTSGYLWQLLKTKFDHVGLYTSPHLVHFSERVRVSQCVLKDQNLLHFLDEIRERLPADLYESLSFFELTTLLAYLSFEKLRTSANVVEVGMGGRWDATNVIEPEASVLVSVSHDHCEYLGNDIASIASEKIGIVRPGRPLFVGSCTTLRQTPAAWDVITKTTERLGCPLFEWGRHIRSEPNETLTINLRGIHYDGITFPERFLAMPDYLKENLGLAAAIFAWLERPTPQELQNYLQRIANSEEACPSLCGRFQRLEINRGLADSRDLLLDVCHNVDGIRRFGQGLLQAGFTRRPGFVSIFKDKEIGPMLDILKGFLEPLVLFKSKSERSMDFDDIPIRHRELPFFDSFDQAWKSANTLWSKQPVPWIVCGSVYAIGEVLQFFGIEPGDVAPAQSLKAFHDTVALPHELISSSRAEWHQQPFATPFS